MTPERKQRFREVIAKRQPGLTVVLENVHDPHNIAAVMRSCDAVGIQELFVLNSDKRVSERWSRRSSASAEKWLDVQVYNDLDACMQAVKSRYEQVYATHLNQDSISLHDMEMSGSLALVFGNEKEGVSEEMLHYVDGNFIIPQVGMIQSLNISVACAVTLYEAFRQRLEKGMYETPQLTEAKQQELYNSYVYRHDQVRRNKANN